MEIGLGILIFLFFAGWLDGWLEQREYGDKVRRLAQKPIQTRF